MGKSPLTQGVVTSNSAGIGPATRPRIHARAREPAVTAYRVPHQVSPAEYDQARCELTGQSDADRQEAELAALPESKRWDPVPGSDGHHAPESPDEDDDDEGRNESAQLVAEGVNEAARDQINQAARAPVAGKIAPTQP